MQTLVWTPLLGRIPSQGRRNDCSTCCAVAVVGAVVGVEVGAVVKVEVGVEVEVGVGVEVEVGFGVMVWVELMNKFLSTKPKDDYTCRVFDSHPGGEAQEIYRGMPESEYFNSSPGLRSSAIKDMANPNLTPAHWKHKWIDGYGQDSSSKSLLEGKIRHRLFEDPSQASIKALYSIIPDKLSLASKEGKAVKEQALEEGKEIIRLSTYLAAVDSVNTLLENPSIRELLEHPDLLVESSVFSKCPETGFTLTARPDLWIPGVAILDLKSTVCAAENKWYWDAIKFGYDLQAHHYLTVCKEETFIFLAQEKTSPFLVAAYEFGGSEIRLAEQKWTAARDAIKYGHENDDWPGYAGGILSRPNRSD